MFKQLFEERKEEINAHISGEKELSAETVKEYLNDPALQEAIVKAGDKNEFVEPTLEV